MPWNTSGTFAVRFSVETLTANREILWPDIDGTIAVGAGIGSGVSILALHRTDTTVEGGELRLHRAVDDGIAWAIDCFGSGSVATVLRFIDAKAATVPMYIDQSSGAVIINKLSVSATATHAGFTLLGSDAPSIKMKKLTGTTAATEGGTVTVAHGLTLSKIISVVVLVAASGSKFVHGVVSAATGFQYDFFTGATNVNVTNHATNSENILSQPFEVFIVYEA